MARDIIGRGRDIRTFKQPRAKIVQQSGKEVPVEVLATAIADVAEAVRRMNGTRLKQDALVILLSEMSGVGKREVRTLLNCLDSLESRWLKPKK